MFERMSKAGGTALKLQLLFNPQLKEKLGGQSLYPLLRLVLPLNDTERGKYGLKQASIAKAIAASLRLQPTSEDAKRLLNWKDPSGHQGSEQSRLATGDFALIVESVLRDQGKKAREPRIHTVGEVNQLLDNIAAASAPEDKMGIIQQHIAPAFSPNELKWLVRILLQDLKLGLGHSNVLTALHPSALQKFNECNSLRRVCEERINNAYGSTGGVQLFVHFSPMLAKGFPRSAQGQVRKYLIVKE